MLLLDLESLLPNSLKLVEVGPRDGLQSLPIVLTTEQKVTIINQLVESGIKEIEVVSFSHPKVLPQMADAEEVMEELSKKEGVVYRGLVPNEYGAHRAAKTKIDEMVALISCDEELNLRNQGMTIEENLRQIKEITKIGQNNNIKVSAGIAASFFSVGRGLTSKETVLEIASQLTDYGITKFYVASSFGMADPRQIYNTITYLYSNLPNVEIGLHLHNRNGMALANAYAGILAGCRWLEGSFLGIGGDAWFPGDADVLGNIPMEDLINFAKSMEIETGISLTKYLETLSGISKVIGRESVSYVTRGGTRKDLINSRYDQV